MKWRIAGATLTVLKTGDTLTLLCTYLGHPIANQYVIAGWESGGGRLRTVNLRSDANGIARLRLVAPGKWFVKFIHMLPVAEEGLNYESNWASLTFEIRSPR